MDKNEPKPDKGRLLPEDEIPYGTDVHLDHGIYDGLYQKKFIEGAQAQLAKIREHLVGEK